MYDPALLARDLKAEALRLGFDGCRDRARRAARRRGPPARGVARGRPPRRLDGAMTWMERNFDKRVDPRELVPGAQSVVSVFAQLLPGRARAGRGEAGRGQGQPLRVGRRLPRRAQREAGRAASTGSTPRARRRGRPRVRGLGARSSTRRGRSAPGWAGRARTRTCSRATHGSFVFLGELIVDVPLEPDAPVHGRPLRVVHALPRRVPDGRARRALPDRRRAVHLVLDHRAPRRRRCPRIGGRVRDLDLRVRRLPGRVPLDQVLPAHARRALPPPRRAHRHAGSASGPSSTSSVFRERFRRSPIKRTKYEGMLRNVRIAQGNAGASAADASQRTGPARSSLVPEGHAPAAAGRQARERQRERRAHALLARRRRARPLICRARRQAIARPRPDPPKSRLTRCVLL